LIQIAEEIAYYLRDELMEELTENKAPSPHKFARVLTEKLKEYIPIRTFVDKDRVIGIFYRDFLSTMGDLQRGREGSREAFL